MIENKRTFGQIIQRLWGPVKKLPGPYIRGSLQSIYWASFDIGLIFLAEYIGNLIQTNTTPGSVYMSIFWIALIVVVLFTLGKFVIRHRGWVQMNPAYQAQIASYLYTKYFPLDYTYIEKLGTGRIINIINDGIQYRSSILDNGAYNIPRLSIKVLFAGYFVFRLGLGYGISFFVGLIAINFFLIKLNKHAHIMRDRRKKEEIERSRQNIRMIVNKQDILQNNKEQAETETYVRQSYDIQKRMRATNNFVWPMFGIPVFFISIVSIVSIAYTGMTIDDGTFALGTYTALVAVAGILTSTVVNITDSFNSATKARTHVEKLRNFLDHGPVTQNMNTGIVFSPKTFSITMCDIGFSYEDTSSILHNLSLSLPGGSKTALVGPSGGGKSTIIKLIAGYLRPDAGSVMIDGQDLTEVSLKSYYQHIGYLTQEPSVFNGTIWENLTYAIGDTVDEMDQVDQAVMERVKQAVCDAQCDFIWDLPNGLETEIGERGVRLSGGQRQRLAIAKIFLKDPEIVLLDEPTSALDSQSEEQVTIAMNRLFEGRTVVVIAHRLQTVKHADKILYMEDRQVVEEGNHKELMKKKEKYYTMVELQSGF